MVHLEVDNQSPTDKLIASRGRGRRYVVGLGLALGLCFLLLCIARLNEASHVLWILEPNPITIVLSPTLLDSPSALFAVPYLTLWYFLYRHHGWARVAFAFMFAAGCFAAIALVLMNQKFLLLSFPIVIVQGLLLALVQSLPVRAYVASNR